jgi:hypothetical protein
MSATRSRANPGGMDVLEVLGRAGIESRPLRERKPAWLRPAESAIARSRS